MEQNLSARRERGSWAPFVGVALAALTIGSLVTFSVVAQRTSLDGFSARGVTAQAPRQAAMQAITLAPAAPPSGNDRTTDPNASAAEADPTALILTPDLDPATDVATTTVQEAATDEAPPSDEVASVPDLAAVPSFEPTAPLLRLSSGGGRADAAGGDEGKREKPKKAKKAKKAKKSDGKSGKAKAKAKARKTPRSGRSEMQVAPPRDHSSAARSSRPSDSARPARPAPSSRSAARPSGHKNTKGKGHSKGRGRGHRHD